MKFIKLSGRPPKKKGIVINHSQIIASEVLGMVKIAGFIAVKDANKAIETVMANKIRIPEWVMNRLVEMKNETA